MDPDTGWNDTAGSGPVVTNGREADARVLSRQSPMFRSLRAAVRFLSKSMIVRKRLPRDLGGGRVFCSPQAMLSMLRPGWRPGGQSSQLFDWVRTYVSEGMHVWDVGANQGLFALAARHRAGPGGKVLAIEPDLFLASLVLRSLVAQGKRPGATTGVLPIALSSESGISEFVIARTDRALNHLADVQGNSWTGGSRRIDPVICIAGDWLAGEVGMPDLIKIDVEGAEHLVLEGLAHVLRVRRPTVIVEVAAQNRQGVATLLGDAEYVMFDIAGDLSSPISTPAWNTLAAPRERGAFG